MNAAITHIGDARESLLDQNFQAGVESDEESTCIMTSVQLVRKRGSERKEREKALSRLRSRLGGYGPSVGSANSENFTRKQHRFHHGSGRRESLYLPWS